MSIVPAQLWTGSSSKLIQASDLYLKKKFCLNFSLNKICDACINCKKIDTKTHSSIIWINSIKTYIKSDIEIIFEKILFSLDPGEKFFFIIFNAELLTDNTANSLLKVIEEPPVGYNFIFFSNRPALVFPTITSRCIIINFDNFDKSEELQNNEYLELFKNAKIEHILTLSPLLDKKILSELEISILLDNLLIYWNNLYKKSLRDAQIDLANIASIKCEIIKESYEHMPMPGSGNFFLKNLFFKLSKF